MNTNGKNKKAFTLIELLVVISIIALLLAILMPALAKVKKQAQAVVCRTNLKQLALGTRLYCQDYNDKVLDRYDPQMMGGIGGQNPLSWFQKIVPYVGSGDQLSGDSAVLGESAEIKVIICPSTKKWDGVSPASATMQMAPTGGLAHGLSYGNNMWMYKNGYTDGNPGYGWTNFSTAPGRVPLLGDSIYYGAVAGLDGDPTPKESGTYTVKEGAWWYYGIPRYVLDRHNMAVNIAFVGGHVEKVPLEDLWQLKWSKQFKPRSVPQSDFSGSRGR